MSYNVENLRRIEDAKNQFSIYLKELNIHKLPISNYSKKYLLNYQKNSDFFINHYTQVFKNAVSKISKPLSEISVLDYGGGCGLMSFLAALSGVKLVIYNDIFETSTHDAQLISNSFNIPIDYFVTGDVDEMVEFIDENKLAVDLIISIDVLEHIYDIEQWFLKLKKIQNPFTLYFNTGANPENLLITRRLMKYQYTAEHVGKEKSFGWKERDTYAPFLKIRKEIIQNYHPHLNENDIDLLAQKSRGLNKKDIELLVDSFLETGTINYVMKHPTNTCDPQTGNWTEHLIDLNHLLKTLKQWGFKAEIEHNKYILSNNFIKDFTKIGLNYFMLFVKKDNLLFSPTYSLMVKNH